MNILKNDEMLQILNNNFVICISNVEEIMKIINCIKTKISVIYITEDYRYDKIKELKDIKTIEKIVIVSKNYNKIKNDNLILETQVSNNTIKKLSSNNLLLIDLNNNYEYAKFIVKNINKLIEGCKKNNKNLGYEKCGKKIIASIINNNSIYLNDLVYALKAIYTPTIKERYELIYDNVCDYLDNNFYCKNICDFHNDRCIASRAGKTNHDTMGCCYSFEYAGPFDLRIVKNVKVCNYLQNGKCVTKNIACKLFTCTYLKKKNICFDTHKILLLECFFNRKQHEIIKSNFFRTREEILNKLLEKNNDTLLWYYMFRKYMIKN